MIEKGNIIQVEYEGRLENGEIFDSSKHDEHSHPLEFEVGSGQVIPGFDEAVLGMKEGEEKEFEIEPENAYGPRREELIKEFPKQMMGNGELPQAGSQIVVQHPSGQQIPATILEIKEDSIVMDFNFPLAGKKLIFKIKIIGVQIK